MWAFPTTWNPDFDDMQFWWYIAGGYYGQSMFEWADDQTMTTMFQFSPNSTLDQTIINVKYKVAVDIWQSGWTGSAFQTRFAIRATDANGDDWWIAKSNYNDTSTYFRNYLYTFDTSILRSELIEDNVGKSWMIS